MGVFMFAYYFGLIALVLSSAIFSGYNDNPAILSSCQKLKALQVSDDIDKYKSAVQECNSNGISVCQCMEYLLNIKQEQAKQHFEKRYNLPASTWQEHENIINEIKMMDGKNAEVIFAGEIPLDIRNHIIAVIGELNISLPIRVIKKSSLDNVASVARFIAQNLETEKISIDKYFTLELRDDFLMSNDSRLKSSVLMHELKHAEYYHILRKFLLYTTLKKNNDISNEAFEKLPETKKFIRAQEAQAERIAAACGDVNGAFNTAYVMTMAHLEETSSGEITFNSKNVADEYHPNSLKELEWATRILKLKEAEAILAKECAQMEGRKAKLTVFQ
jgi:hypothetical protein